MKNLICQSPILLLVFNRPEKAQQVFDRIKAVQPSRLYIACDGPRSDREGEEELVRETQKITEQVDWDCEVKTLFRDQNLGCSRAVSGAVSWFFSTESRGIILEDDCVPTLEAFKFFDDCLAKYETDQSILDISGFNPVERISKNIKRPLLSRYGVIWGWASWADRWAASQSEDFYGKHLTGEEKKEIVRYFGNRIEADYCIRFHAALRDQKIDSWASGYSMSRCLKKLYSIVPPVNLVENIGFGDDATHTFGESVYPRPKHPLKLKTLDAKYYRRCEVFAFLARRFKRIVKVLS